MPTLVKQRQVGLYEFQVVKDIYILRPYHHPLKTKNKKIKLKKIKN